MDARWTVVSLSAAFVVSVLGAAWATSRGPLSPVPAPVVASERTRIASAAEHVRLGLNEAVDDLLVVAALDVADLGPLLGEIQDNRPRYASLAVVLDGEPIASTGGDFTGLPRLPSIPAVLLGPAQGQEPQVFFSVPIVSHPGQVLVARYASEYLTFPLQGPGTRWLIDDQGRILASDSGFVAYARLPEGLPMSCLSTAAGCEDGVPARPRTLAFTDGPRLLSASRVVGTGPAGALSLSVIGDRPVDTLAIGDHDAHRRLLLLSWLAVLAVVLSLGWLLVTVALPLRHLARDAQRIANGNHGDPIVARRSDEVGVVARHLERIRLLLSDSGTTRRRP